MRLRDGVAIVTGRGDGIGKAIALTFASEVASAALYLALDDFSTLVG